MYKWITAESKLYIESELLDKFWSGLTTAGQAYYSLSVAKFSWFRPLMHAHFQIEIKIWFEIKSNWNIYK